MRRVLLAVICWLMMIGLAGDHHSPPHVLTGIWQIAPRHQSGTGTGRSIDDLRDDFIDINMERGTVWIKAEGHDFYATVTVIREDPGRVMLWTAPLIAEPGRAWQTVALIVDQDHVIFTSPGSMTAVERIQ
jgi:hypothetical protein